MRKNGKRRKRFVLPSPLLPTTLPATSEFECRLQTEMEDFGC